MATWVATLTARHGFAHPHLYEDRPARANPSEEAFVHLPAGFDRAGGPAKAQGDDVARLQITVVDAATGAPAFCRVNVVGPDGNFYEPAENPLSPWSLARAANREGKGPIRYYGWFFYTSGECTVEVPHGPVRVEVSKGYEYRPVALSTQTVAGEHKKLRITLKRTLPTEPHGYYSGDTHIHLDRRTEEEDQRALDLIAAEDVRFGFILAMNDPSGYSGIMERQIWPQQRGFGPTSIESRGLYSICSGQEYRASTYGHICLLMHRQLVWEGNTVDPNRWPVFGLVGEETRRLGGYSFHAHGGYSKEIYADFAQRATDGVELLQFAEYRGISLEGWYRILNVGYRFPAVGASDFPYCRALSDCRTYVHIENEPTFAEWARGAASGRSFFTTGPIILLDVDGHRPGEIASLKDSDKTTVTARVRVRCEVAPVTQVDLIQNGRRIDSLVVPASVGRGSWLELKTRVNIDESSWIAARAYSVAPTGSPDAEAHTNPVYVYLNGRPPYHKDDLAWLIDRLDERIEANRARDAFDEQEAVLEFFQESKSRLEKIRQNGGLPADKSD